MEEVTGFLRYNRYELKMAFREFCRHYRRYKYYNPERINAYDLAQNTRAKLENTKSPYVSNLMLGLENSISVELDFIEWLSKNQKKGMLNNAPSDVFEHIMDVYVSERGKGVDEKRKLLRVYRRTGWRRFLEQAQKVIFTKRKSKDFT